MKHAIYQAYNNITGESYIGVTKQDLNARRRQHERLAARGAHESHKFGEALVHYGFDNFTWNILDYVDDPYKSEEEYIRLYDAVDRGYNTKYGELHSVTVKPLICISTGEVFNSVTECANFYGLQLSKIAAVCRGQRGSHGGYIFRYLDDLGNIIEPVNAKPPHRAGFISDQGNMFSNYYELSKYTGLSEYTLKGRMRKNGYIDYNDEIIRRER